MPLALIPILVMMLFALPGARADAASWSSPTTIAANGDVQFDLAMGADGTAAVAYSDARGVQVAVRRAGHGWSSPRLVSGGRFTTTRPSVSVTGSGEVVVAWAQSGSTVTRPNPTIGPLTVRAARIGRAARAQVIDRRPESTPKQWCARTALNVRIASAHRSTPPFLHP